MHQEAKSADLIVNREPEQVKCSLWAWIMESKPGEIGIPMVPLQAHPGAPPMPMTLCFLRYEDALKAKTIAQDIASQTGKKMQLIGMDVPEVKETVEPKRIVMAGPSHLMMSRG